MATTEAQKKANAKYDANNTRRIMLKLNIKTDADILAKLDAVTSKQGYIKDLIRADMEITSVFQTYTDAAGNGEYIECATPADAIDTARDWWTHTCESDRQKFKSDPCGMFGAYLVNKETGEEVGTLWTAI